MLGVFLVMFAPWPVVAQFFFMLCLLLHRTAQWKTLVYLLSTSPLIGNVVSHATDADARLETAIVCHCYEQVQARSHDALPQQPTKGTPQILLFGSIFALWRS